VACGKGCGWAAWIRNVWRALTRMHSHRTTPSAAGRPRAHAIRSTVHPHEALHQPAMERPASTRGHRLGSARVHCRAQPPGKLQRSAGWSSVALLPALLFAAAGTSTDAAPPDALGRGQASAFRRAFLPCLPVQRASPGRLPVLGAPADACLQLHRWRLPGLARPLVQSRARGVWSLMAQEQHGAPAAKWRPPPLDNYSSAESEGTGDDLTPSDDSDDEGEDDSGNFSGNAAAGSADEPAAKPTIAPNEQVVVGAGALRGEQEAYSMRDVQSMKVPRLRAMCEARGLKKNGTKQQLINRLLASTADSLDAIPGWTDRKRY